MKAPKYEPRSIIDLRFSHETMPDRIYVEMVYQRDKSNCWMYRVISEKCGKVEFMREDEIDKFISKKIAKVYENPVVQDLYKKGFRFCGNSKKDTAFARALKLKPAQYISEIVLVDAFNNDGDNIIGEYGLWVKYNLQITSDAEIDGYQKNADGYLVIK